MATSRILGSLAVATLIGVTPTAGQQVSTPANRNRRVITTEEIEQAQETNAFQVVGAGLASGENQAADSPIGLPAAWQVRRRVRLRRRVPVR